MQSNQEETGPVQFNQRDERFIHVFIVAVGWPPETRQVLYLRLRPLILALATASPRFARMPSFLLP